jgi:hypothetical protein
MRLVRTHRLEAAVAWVCHHVDSVFGGDLVKVLDLAEFCDGDWLNSVAAADGTYLRWEGTMRARLAERSPLRLSPAGEPRFGAIARGTEQPTGRATC